jgi:hypothetical protein
MPITKGQQLNEATAEVKIYQPEARAKMTPRCKSWTFAISSRVGRGHRGGRVPMPPRHVEFCRPRFAAPRRCLPMRVQRIHPW